MGKFIIIQYLKTKKAQTILEYTIVIGAVVAILLTMSPYLQRLIQGSIKVAADQIGFQENADQDFTVGYLNVAYTTIDTVSDKTMNELGGITSYFYDDTTSTTSNGQVYLGVVGGQ